MSKVKCLACGNIIESKEVHMMVLCGCDNRTFVDGGRQYTRVGGEDLEMVEVIEAYRAGELLNDAVPIEEPTPPTFGEALNATTKLANEFKERYEEKEYNDEDRVHFLKTLVFPYHKSQRDKIKILHQRIREFGNMIDSDLNPEESNAWRGIILAIENLYEN